MKARFEGVVGAAVRRPVLTLSIALALAIGGGVLALGMQTDAGADTFVSGSTPSAQATADDHQHFGGDAVVILIREPLTDLVETKDLATSSQLEACLAGQTLAASTSLGAFTSAPASQPPYGGWSSPCGRLRKSRAVEVVYGPGTFLNRAVVAVNKQEAQLLGSVRQGVLRYERAAYELAIARHLSRKQAGAAAKAAGQLELANQEQTLTQLALQSGLTGPVQIDDVSFIRQVVFDATRGVNQPKARFSYLFPTANSALIQVRLKPSLSSAQQASAISLIRHVIRMPQFRLSYGGTYTVSGVPVVVSDLASTLTSSIVLLLVAALVVMAATLMIVFRGRLRLLPLAIALAACGITFGLIALFGGTLTIASIAVLPILIGLAVDYAIQFQSRAQEARAAQAGKRLPAVRAIAAAATSAAPTIATAALATGTGFLVLQLSPVPMVRAFGVLLVVGIAVALVLAFTAGAAAIVLADRGVAVPGVHVPAALAASLRGAWDILADLGDRLRPRWPARPLHAGGPSRLRAAGSGALAAAVRNPGRLLAIGALLAVLGWVADTQTSVQSDVTKLVPSNMPALRDLHTLERVTGVSGELDVVVHSSNVATPKTIGWMLQYEDTLLTHYGYLETKGCSHATLCPALSLPDLFCSGSQSTAACTNLSASQISGLLDAVPGYFSQAVITRDRREATLAFGIRLMPLSRQQRVIDYMRAQLHPPPGITAQLAGLPVLAAQANADLSSAGRRLLTLLAGLIAVGLVLLAVFRNPKRALVPLIPIALATGWSALILFLIGIPLNPMSAAMGTLVIAISTEFSVLLSERFRQERRDGYELADALSRTYRFTGAAVLASGITAIAGFGVLILSNITMLRDFGFVTLVDLSVSLAGVMLVLPAVLALSERRELAGRLRDARWPRDGFPRLRRRARVA
ncbi:MAG TPA: MMPL family transporter [Solirubrobacteraceae bacterium]|nr:MMPL family transporter [Solirubrobacteraceae bacterium]